jgi:hypothetical protein
MRECANQPFIEDEEQTPRERKIPDFQWGFWDDTAPVEQAERYFVVECKRLGSPLRSDQVFNELYVEKGIQRFVSAEHGYAAGEPSAAMIGYVQSMELQAIYTQVNAAASSSAIPHLNVDDAGWQSGGTTHLFHRLIRPFPISPFDLEHYWVDLRPRTAVVSSVGTAQSEAPIVATP